MTKPTPESLAQKLFSLQPHDAETLHIFARGLVYLNVIRALVWGVVTVLNFVALILAPLWLALLFDTSRYLFLCLPGLLIALVLAATAPSGTQPERKNKNV